MNEELREQIRVKNLVIRELNKDYKSVCEEYKKLQKDYKYLAGKIEELELNLFYR